MAICHECKQEMGDVDSCTYNIIIISGEKYERSREHFAEPDGRCNDCGIKHGGIHHFGCDVERCPKCGLQLIGCYCTGVAVGLARTQDSPGKEVKDASGRQGGADLHQ